MRSITSIDWARLLAVPRWSPLAALGVEAVGLGGTLYKISSGAYLTCVQHDAQLHPVRGHLLTAVWWAASDGAARRAQLMEIEADDLVVEPPPDALLPQAGSHTYGSIIRALRDTGRAFDEWADYRIAKDGAFVHRTLNAPPHAFHFRRPEEDRSDACYAIQYRLPLK